MHKIGHSLSLCSACAYVSPLQMYVYAVCLSSSFELVQCKKCVKDEHRMCWRTAISSEKLLSWSVHEAAT